MSVTSSSSERVVPVVNMSEFFRDSVDAALASQQVNVSPHTSHYVVNLLTMFARSEKLFLDATGRRGTKPLAFMLADALESTSTVEQTAALRRLGDVALFMSGFFSHSFAGKPVDIDYYVYMGGSAYGSLSDIVRGTALGSAYSAVFDELAEKFQALVDVLGEISDMARGTSDKDTLRLFEIWLKTGSRRAEAQLKSLGIYPMRAAPNALTH